MVFLPWKGKYEKIATSTDINGVFILREKNIDINLVLRCLPQVIDRLVKSLGSNNY